MRSARSVEAVTTGGIGAAINFAPIICRHFWILVQWGLTLDDFKSPLFSLRILQEDLRSIDLISRPVRGT